MPVWKRRQNGFRVSNFSLLMVVFKWHHGSEGVNKICFVGRTTSYGIKKICQGLYRLKWSAMRDTYTCTVSGLLFVCTPPRLTTALTEDTADSGTYAIWPTCIQQTSRGVVVDKRQDTDILQFGRMKYRSINLHTSFFSVWGVATAWWCYYIISPVSEGLNALATWYLVSRLFHNFMVCDIHHC